jgi:multidrug resistance efflux pump
LEEAMTENVENLLLEHMKRFQAALDRIERKMEELIARVGRLEVSVAGLRGDISHAEANDAALSVRLDRVSARLDRVEKRLELAD